MPTDSSGKARRKRIVYRYANEQSDRLLARPLNDKSLPHSVTKPAHTFCYAEIYVGIVKLSIVRGRTSINLPSNSRALDMYHFATLDMYHFAPLNMYHFAKLRPSPLA
jgi:hypothetical protein